MQGGRRLGLRAWLLAAALMLTLCLSRSAHAQRGIDVQRFVPALDPSGFLAVQGLNVVRVISLFYLGQWNTQVFNFAHEYLWQALIMLDVLVVWLLWVRAGSKSQESSVPPPPPEDPPAPPAHSAASPKPAGPLVSASLDLSPPVR